MRSRSNWNLKVLVFKKRGKPEYQEKNLSQQGREPTTKSTHIWCLSSSKLWPTYKSLLDLACLGFYRFHILSIKIANFCQQVLKLLGSYSPVFTVYRTSLGCSMCKLDQLLLWKVFIEAGTSSTSNTASNSVKSVDWRNSLSFALIYSLMNR